MENGYGNAQHGNGYTGSSSYQDDNAVAPMILKALRVVEQIESESDVLELHCDVLAWPEPNWKWTKNLEIIEDNLSGHHAIRVDPLPSNDPASEFTDCFRGRLILYGVNFSDEGVYEVEASNFLGDATSAVKLSFEGGKSAETIKSEKKKKTPSGDSKSRKKSRSSKMADEGPSPLPPPPAQVVAKEQQHHYSFVVNDNGQLTIGMDKLNVIGPVAVTWYAGGKAVVKEAGSKMPAANGGSSNSHQNGGIPKYDFECFYSDESETNNCDSLICISSKLYINEISENDCCIYECLVRGQVQDQELKRKFELTSDFLERLKGNRGTTVTKKKNIKTKKSENEVIEKSSAANDTSSSGKVSKNKMAKTQIEDTKNKENAVANGEVLLNGDASNHFEHLDQNKTESEPSPLLAPFQQQQRELTSDASRNNGADSANENQIRTTNGFPVITIADRADIDIEADDIVMDLPRIPSRVASRRSSIEDSSFDLSFLGQMTLQVFQPPETPPSRETRTRRDSGSSVTSDPGANEVPETPPVSVEAKPRLRSRRRMAMPVMEDVNLSDAPADENEPPSSIPTFQRGRRMSAIDISKSTQQRLLRLSQISTTPNTASDSPFSPATPEVTFLNPDMELFKQRRMLQQQHITSRRQSLAEIIPDWPSLDSGSKKDFRLSEERLLSSGTSGKLDFLPQRFIDVENIEMQQFERRRSSLVASRRRSLAEVIPDWPQLQKPKEKLDFWLDDLEDVTSHDEDSRAELSCRFSNANVKVRWFKGDMEIFHGEKYNFLVDDDGVIRLIIQRIVKEDEGRYTCLINKRSTSAELVVEEKEYHFDRKMLASVTVKERSTLVLECQLCDIRPVVTWARNSEMIEYTTGLYEISRRDNRCILKLPNISKIHNGARFVCSVYNDTTSCDVTVEDPEYEFIRPIADRDCFEKETVIFECELNYDGAPVRWLKNGRVIKKSEGKYQKKVKGVLHRLIITNVDNSDQASYSCVVQDKTSSAKLFVAPDVVILGRLENINILEHETLILAVRVKNPKKYPVEWFRNGKRMPETLSTKSINGKSEETNTLTIENMSLTDAGKYICKIGDRETCAHVVVEECQLPPSVNYDQIPREIVVRAGRGIKLEVPYTGTPIPSAAWTKDKAHLGCKNSGHAATNQTRNKCTLTIDDSVRSDSGEYELVLSNQCGEVIVPITVNVIDAPSEPGGPLTVLDIFEDRCRLHWEEPSDKGGLPLNGYVVEAFDQTLKKSGPTFRVNLDTQCGVHGLVPGHKYRFKVKAVNAEGDSAWLATDKDTLAKDPWDPPSKPGTPEIKDFDRDQAEIQWGPSEKDGGSPILKYVIEKRLISKDWQTVGMVPPSELDAIIPDLQEGEVYEFRVVAVNQAGRGDYSEPSEPVKIKATKLAAKIDHTSYESSVKVKAGNDFHLEILYYGEPAPEIKWLSENKEALDDERHFRIRNSRNCSMLSCRDSKRLHSSLYTVVVSNAHGRDDAVIDVVIIDVPDKPEGPLEVCDIKKSSVILRWRHPENTGGKPVTNYVIEKKIVGSPSWERLTQFVSGNLSEIKLNKLKTGETHLFRVAAENEVGLGDFLTTTSGVTVQNQFGRPEPPSKPFLMENGTTFITIAWNGDKQMEELGECIGFNVERKNLRSQTGEWIRLNENPFEEQFYSDDHLKPNSLFLYRILLENEEGCSDPGPSSEPISTLSLDEKPTVSMLDVKDLSLMKEQDLKIVIPFSANPVPRAEWKVLRQNRDDFDLKLPCNKRFSIVGGGSDSDRTSLKSKRRRHSISQFEGSFLQSQMSSSLESGLMCVSLESDGRVSIEVENSIATLLIKNTSLFDTGLYKLKLVNSVGCCDVSFKVTVLGLPSAPEGPLEISDLTSEGVTLRWKPPMCDGGSPLLRYVIEKRLGGRGTRWTKVVSNIKPRRTDNQATLIGLDCGVGCEFRVFAVNEVGDGEPLETSHIVVPGSIREVPDVLKNLRCIQLSDSTACLSWDDPCDDKVLSYVVEKKEKSAHYWSRVNSSAAERNETLIKHLTLDKDYQLRVAAINHAGVGMFEEVSFTPRVMQLAASPKIKLNSSSLNVVVHLGQPLRVRIPYSGFPKPEITATDTSGMPLEHKQTDERIRIEESDQVEEFLLVKDAADRSDVGTYKIYLVNPLGGDEARVNISVLTPPSPPQKPLRVSNVKGTSYLLSWRPPLDSGGKPITHYIVEMKEGENSQKWKCLNKYCRKNELRVDELDEGQSYEFKVSAFNEVGMGEPLCSDEPLVVPKALELPSPPDRPRVEVNKDKKVHILWTNSKQRTKTTPEEFIVEACEKGSSDWLVSGTVSAYLGNSYEVTDPEKPGEFQFRVRGANKWGAGEPSLPSSFVTVGKKKVPKSSGLITGIEQLPSGSFRIDWCHPLEYSDQGIILEKRKLNTNGEESEWEPVGANPHFNKYYIVDPDNCYTTDGKDGDTTTTGDHQDGGGESKVTTVEYRARLNDGASSGGGYDSVDSSKRRASRQWSDLDDGERLLMKPQSKEGKAPEFLTPLQNVGVQLGEEVLFTSRIAGKPWPIVRWYLNSNLVSNAGRFLKNENSTTGISELAIKESKLSDFGTVTCELSNFYGKNSSSAELTLLAHPCFHQALYELNLDKNESHKLRIPFTGSNPRQFNLSIDDLHLSKSSSFYDDEDDAKEDFEDQVELMEPNEKDEYVLMVVKKAKMFMNNKIYLLKLSNVLGSAICEVKIVVKGPPTSCSGSLKISDVTKTSCQLSWKPPSGDGGSKVQHYVVEKRDMEKSYWTSACPNVKSSQTDVQGLIEGKTYMFRVAAVNASGIGQYLSSPEPIVARLPFSVPECPGKPSVVDFTFKSATIEWSSSPMVKFFDSFAPSSEGDSTSPSPLVTYTVEKTLVNGGAGIGYEGEGDPSHPNSDADDDDVVDDDDLNKVFDKRSDGNDNEVREHHRSYGWSLACISNLCVPQLGGHNRNVDRAAATADCSCVVDNLLEGRRYRFRVVPHNEAGQGQPSAPSDPVLIAEKTAMPKFLVTLSDTDVLEGRSVELQVEVAGLPKPTVVWYKGSQALSSTPGKYEIDADDHVHTLVIKRVNQEDEDEYVVKATNELGSRISRAALVVSTPPRIQSSQLYQAPLVQDKGSNVNIKLYYTCHPPPSIEWLKDGERIEFMEKPKPEIPAETSTASSSSSSSVQYKSPYEPRQRRFSLTSRFLNSSGSNVSSLANQNSSSSLATAPLAERRKFEGTPRYVTMQLSYVQPSDKGEYSVVLSNEYGTDQLNIQIKVNDVPGPPCFLKSENVQNNGLTLCWKEPTDDGGSTVTQYFVEILHEAQDVRWLPHSLTRFSHCNVENLISGKIYKFRVGAINVFGRGSPCQPISIETGTENKQKDSDSTFRRSSSRQPPEKVDYDQYYTNIWRGGEPRRMTEADGIRNETVTDFYDVHEQLGSGQFGTLNRVVEKATGRSFVCQFVDLSVGSEDSGDSDNDDDNSRRRRRDKQKRVKKNKELVRDEIKNMAKLHHRKIHHLHEVFEEEEKMAIIMEYLSGEDLLKRLTNEDERFTEEVVAKFMRQVCEALQHMHEKNMAHLFIKPENLICSTLKSSEVKVTNFGSSAILDPDKMVALSKSALECLAPEVIDGRAVGFYSDMWSVGVVSYVLLTGKYPFDGPTRTEKMKKIIDCKWSMDCKQLKLSEAAKDFVANLLEKDPQMRMTVQEALDHPWLCQECNYSTKVFDPTKYSQLIEKSEKDGQFSAPVLAIGSLINSTSLTKSEPKKYQIASHRIDRKEVQPRFIWKPKNCASQEGSSASFKCKIISSDRLTVTWFKDSSELKISPKYSIQSTGDYHELRVTRVCRSDAGEYVVRAENKYGRVEEAALLTIEGDRHSVRKTTLAQRSQSLEPVSAFSKSLTSTTKTSLDTVLNLDSKADDLNREPAFTFSLRDRTIQEGSSFKLSTCVEGHPLPKITWYRDGRELLKSSFDYDISFSHGMCTLEVDEAKVGHGGRYSCRASNSRGSTETSCLVTVYGGSERRSSLSRESPLSSRYSPVATSALSSSSSSSISAYTARSYSRRFSRCSIDRL